jgi:uncharacterized membrane protein
MKDKLVHRFIIGTFVSLYLLVSIISTIHVIEFFKLSNPYWLAVSLAIGFELGAAASLASLIILDKMNKTLVWMLFGAITLMQMQGNMYYAFVHMENFQGWSELFGLIEEDIVYQKRVLSAVSGAILPLVALGFIKSLVDYIKPQPESLIKEEAGVGEETKVKETQEEKFTYTSEELEEAKEWDVTLEDGLEDEPIVEEVKEERDEDHELDLVLNEMVEDLETPSAEENNTPSDFVGGYYGDILIDGNGPQVSPQVQIEENNILPVNSNTPISKNTGIIDNSGSVHLNPTTLL